MDRAKLLELAGCTGTFLDIGTGPLTTIAAKNGLKVTSIDIDEERLDEEKENAKAEGVFDRIDFVKADALSLPFPDNSFDFAVSYGALHHIDEKDRDKFVDEALRVAKKIVIADFDKETFPHGGEYKMVDYSWLKKKLGNFDYHYIDGMYVYITAPCKK